MSETSIDMISPERDIIRAADLEVTQGELETLFRVRNGKPETTGWRPRTRHRFHYFTPDEYYEAIVAKLIDSDCRWLDVGCGRDIFPGNRPLARLLADRCQLLVGVDPDRTLEENPFVHERVRSSIEDFQSNQTFDVVTMRMVAEHIPDPDRAMASLARLTKPGGKVVIYTINRWSPVPIITRITPFGLHHPIKRFLWRTEKKDTFPVTYKMNTRTRLARLFESCGFQECYFVYLDDCRSFSRFRMTLFMELLCWRFLRVFRIRYPENCLLGVYVRN